MRCVNEVLGNITKLVLSRCEMLEPHCLKLMRGLSCSESPYIADAQTQGPSQVHILYYYGTYSESLVMHKLHASIQNKQIQ